MAEPTAQKLHRGPGRPFKPGADWKGNRSGRPKGARSKLDDAFLAALCADFKAGGVEAIRKCREERPDIYLNVIAKVLPKQVDVTADDTVADLASGLHAVADFLGGFANGAC